jgi:hypothetical protein
MDSNPVALAVASALKAGPHPHLGAVVIRGFLDAGTEEAPLDPVQLYTDESFRVWFEFPAEKILHHIRGGLDPFYPLGAVWLRRETPVVKHTSGCAYVFTEKDAMLEDPGGGPHGKPTGYP